MSKSKVIFSVATLIVLTPMLGFPRSWETTLIVFFALMIMGIIIVPVSFVRKVLGLHERITDNSQTTLPLSFTEKEDLAEEDSNRV